jgi:hypothetical protein
VSTNPDDPNVTAYTIINGNNSTRAFTFNSGEDSSTIVDGFRIVNGGLFAQPGGAIYVGNESSPTIMNVAISDCNVAYASGGAIYVDANCSPTFRNVTITNCRTTSGGNGGGVYVHINATPTFAKCAISNCTTEGFGGAAYCSNESAAVFVDCNFVNNHANYSGGGLYYAADAISTLTRCNIAYNRADVSGGGIRYNVGCSVQVNDCNFVDNSALQDRIVQGQSAKAYSSIMTPTMAEVQFIYATAMPCQLPIAISLIIRLFAAADCTVLIRRDRELPPARSSTTRLPRYGTNTLYQIPPVSRFRYRGTTQLLIRKIRI